MLLVPRTNTCSNTAVGSPQCFTNCGSKSFTDCESQCYTNHRSQFYTNRRSQCYTNHKPNCDTDCQSISSPQRDADGSSQCTAHLQPNGSTSSFTECKSYHFPIIIADDIAHVQSDITAKLLRWTGSAILQ